MAPTSEIDASDTGLCYLCAAVDFSGVADKGITVLRNVGKDFAQSRSQSCPLCDVIAWILVTIPEEVEKDNLRLISGKNVRGQRGYYNRFQIWEFQATTRATALTLVRDTDIYDNGPSVGYCSWAWPDHRLAVLTDEVQKLHHVSPYLLPSIINTHQVDFGKVKGWLDACHHNHKKCGTVKRPKVPIQVIDCHSLQLLEAPKDCQYVTLSYVWGNSQTDSDDLSKAPATIRDAMQVTVTLGYRYLWIDRYCIHQNEPGDKAAQIKQMDLVYSGSVFTIIAAAGQSPEYGLPGVGHRPREEQMSRVVRGRHLIGALDHPRDLVTDSVWMTRAWTYQEGMLAKRRLIFTEQQVYFDCQKMWVEELGKDLRGSDVGIRLTISGGGYGPKHSMFESMNCGNDSEAIFDIISSYSTRSLSFTNDRLNGLQGLLNALAAEDQPAYHVQGVPIISKSRDYQACGPRRTMPKWPLETAFMVGMTWSVKPQLRPDTEFPSWSWLAWSGQVRWPTTNEAVMSMNMYWIDKFHDLPPRSDSLVWVEFSQDDIRSLDVYMSSVQTLGLSQPMVVHIESDTFEVNLLRLTRPLEVSFTFKANLAKGDETRRYLIPSGDWAVWKSPSGGCSYSSFKLFDTRIDLNSNSASIAVPGLFKVLVLAKHDRGENGDFAEGKVLRRVITGRRVDSSEIATYEVVGHVTRKKEHLTRNKLISFSTDDEDLFNRWEASDSMPEKTMPEVKREKVRLV